MAIGFVGVTAVVRPTPDGFSPWALLVIGAAASLVVREFATQRISVDTPPLPIALLTAVAVAAMMGPVSTVAGWDAFTIRAVITTGRPDAESKQANANEVPLHEVPLPSAHNGALWLEPNG